MKYRKTKKLFSKKEALEMIEICKTSIEASQEAISSWQYIYPAGIVLCVLLSEFGSLENAIIKEKSKIQYNLDKIEDCKRFL